ncbi:LicD family protein [Legionella beliardensis]|uniref:LicD family protein n=1 Tax=Legionella beliardensis TaxID=91822 RepID=UPI001F5F515F|nr:LicD family protein [Legionella beliardensis]
MESIQLSEKLTHSPQEILADGRLRRAQLKMLEMLTIIDSICVKYQIDYWLDAGTLLGAIRHQGFIPWDDDMDIAMPRESYEKFLQVAPLELPAHMHLQQAGIEPGYYNLGTPLKIRDRSSYYLERHEKGNEPYVQGIFIDIFVYDKMTTIPWKRRFYKRLSRKCLRMLGTKHSLLPMGRSHNLYRTLGYIFPKAVLNKALNYLVSMSKKIDSPYLGRGYHCKKVTLIEFTEVYPLKRALFENRYFNIPNKAESILSKEYGDYQTLPPESERTLRHCIKLITEV